MGKMLRLQLSTTLSTLQSSVNHLHPISLYLYQHACAELHQLQHPAEAEQWDHATTTGNTQKRIVIDDDDGSDHFFFLFTDVVSSSSTGSIHFRTGTVLVGTGGVCN